MMSGAFVKAPVIDISKQVGMQYGMFLSFSLAYVLKALKT